MIQFYIAGNYTAATEQANLLNVRRALLAAMRVVEARGWFPIVPHCSLNHTTPWPEAMRRCIETVEGLDVKTDCLVVLPGWEQSKGAVMEVSIAKCRGLAVLELAEVIA